MYSKRILDRMRTIRKHYPKTWRTVRKVALRTGKPVGAVLSALNFSKLMQREDWYRTPLFRRMKMKLVELFERLKNLKPAK